MNQPYYYIQGIIAKDRKIFEEFYQESRLTVFTMAYLIVGDVSCIRLIMGDIYKELVRRAASYALGDSFSGWMLGITAEVATRKYWEMVKKEDGPKEKDELKRKLDEYLGTLEHEARLVYLLHDVAGVSLRIVKKHAHTSLWTMLLLENKAERLSERNSLMLGNDNNVASAKIEKIIVKYIPAEAPDVDLEAIEAGEVYSSDKAAAKRLLRQLIWTGIMIVLFIILIIIIARA